LYLWFIAQKLRTLYKM